MEFNHSCSQVLSALSKTGHAEHLPLLQTFCLPCVVRVIRGQYHTKVQIILCQDKSYWT